MLLKVYMYLVVRNIMIMLLHQSPTVNLMFTTYGYVVVVLRTSYPACVDQSIN
jgi:hypothetical protein